MYLRLPCLIERSLSAAMSMYICARDWRRRAAASLIEKRCRGSKAINAGVGSGARFLDFFDFTGHLFVERAASIIYTR
jgi:hypothetical protein